MSVSTWSVEPATLRFKEPFRTARGVRQEVVNVHVRWTVDGLAGRGEAHPSARYGNTADGVLDSLRQIAPPPPEGQLADWLAEVDRRFTAVPPAVRSALVMAGCELHALRAGLPLSALWPALATPPPATSMTLSIDTPGRVAAAAATAAERGFPALKMKVGEAGDRERVAAVRGVCDLPLRVDANEGWASREQAAEEIEWLSAQGVELVEQPLPAGRLDDVAWLRNRSALPLFADEDAVGVCVGGGAARGQLGELAGAYDGVNLKLEKNGGLDLCLAAAGSAREQGLETLLGCFPGSSLGIAAAVAIAPAFDRIDLDAPLFLKDDPFGGLRFESGVPHVEAIAGIGVSVR